MENLYGLVCEVLEGPKTSATRWDLFEQACTMLASATVHDDALSARSIALDGTSIDSWGTRRRRGSKKLGTEGGSTVQKEPDSAFKIADPDAAWRSKGIDKWKRPVFGYDLTAAVSVPEVDGGGVPLSAKSIRIRPANFKTLETALAVVGEVARIQGSLGDVLADREYTKSIDGKDFLLPVRALGGEPVFDLTKNQAGARETRRAAKIIDGHPFSPSLPTSLESFIRPAVNADKKLIGRYQDQMDDRAKYALVAHGSRKVSGSHVYQCPASAGKLRCPLVASSQLLALGTMPAFPATMDPLPRTVCTQKYTTFDAEDIALPQRELHGTTEWYKSVNRRNRVEGFFGNLKDSARENISRGTVRVRGLVRTGLMIAIAVMSVNIRLGEKWDEQKRRKPKPRMGRPRKVGVTKYAQVFLDLVANAPPLAS